MTTLPRTFDDILRLPRLQFVNRALLPSASGVYFVLYEAGVARIGYIGKADDFRARWTGHHRVPEFDLLGLLAISVEIAWTVVPKAELDAAEAQMIALFQPPLNDRLTLRRRQKRITAPRSALTTTPEILQDFRQRRDMAVQVLRSDAFWRQCNEEEDGDLTCLWPFPEEYAAPSINDVCFYSDTHPLAPFRVPYPPGFEDSAATPKDGFSATAAERRAWTMEVAKRVDAWLVAVAGYLGAINGASRRADVLTALAKEESLLDLLHGS